MSHSADGGVVAACALCGAPDRMINEYIFFGGLSVCHDCSEKIANAWSKKHIGEYLTWGDRGMPAGYRKLAIPEALRWRVFERDDYRCVSCGTRHFLRADHIHPESRGGLATLDNLQTLCRSCNSRKGARIEVRN